MAAQPKEIILNYCQQRAWAAREKQNIVASQGNIIHCVTTQREIDSRKEPDRCGAAAAIVWIMSPPQAGANVVMRLILVNIFFLGR